MENQIIEKTIYNPEDIQVILGIGKNKVYEFKDGKFSGKGKIKARRSNCKSSRKVELIFIVIWSSFSLPSNWKS